MSAAEIRKRIDGIWGDVAEIPAIKCGLVHCPSCKREIRVDGLRAMQSGWPMCCGYTMYLGPSPNR